MKKVKEFTLYWRTGEREVVQGRTPADATTLAGHGGISLLDFYVSGNDNHYKWNATSREWDAIEESVHELAISCEDDDEDDPSKPPF